MGHKAVVIIIAYSNIDNAFKTVQSLVFTDYKSMTCNKFSISQIILQSVISVTIQNEHISNIAYILE